jgi:hypothetical protein
MVTYRAAPRQQNYEVRSQEGPPTRPQVLCVASTVKLAWNRCLRQGKMDKPLFRGSPPVTLRTGE